MIRYEYKVIQASELHPKGFWRKARERTASAVTDVLNQNGNDGWEFVRAEVLRSQAKGWLGRPSPVEIDVLVFRRAMDATGASSDDATLVLKAPKAAPPVSRQDKRSRERREDIALVEIAASSNSNAAPPRPDLPHGA